MWNFCNIHFNIGNVLKISVPQIIKGLSLRFKYLFSAIYKPFLKYYEKEKNPLLKPLSLSNNVFFQNCNSLSSREKFDKHHPFVCLSQNTSNSKIRTEPRHNPKREIDLNPFKLWTYHVQYKHFNLVRNKTTNSEVRKRKGKILKQLFN